MHVLMTYWGAEKAEHVSLNTVEVERDSRYVWLVTWTNRPDLLDRIVAETGRLRHVGDEYFYV